MPELLPLMGLYGKVPAHGDFVRRGLPSSFVTPWDDWLQAGIARAREGLGPNWADAWDAAPAWRFALPAGVCGPDAVAGVMLPSMDTVGRRFPITLAAVLPPGALPPEAAWFDALEGAALAGRGGGADADALAAAIPDPTRPLPPAAFPLAATAAIAGQAGGEPSSWSPAGTGPASLPDGAAGGDVLSLLGGLAPPVTTGDPPAAGPGFAPPAVDAPEPADPDATLALLIGAAPAVPPGGAAPPGDPLLGLFGQDAGPRAPLPAEPDALHALLGEALASEAGTGAPTGPIAPDDDVMATFLRSPSDAPDPAAARQVPGPIPDEADFAAVPVEGLPGLSPVEAPALAATVPAVPGLIPDGAEFTVAPVADLPFVAPVEAPAVAATEPAVPGLIPDAADFAAAPVEDLPFVAPVEMPAAASAKPAVPGLIPDAADFTVAPVEMPPAASTMPALPGLIADEADIAARPLEGLPGLAPDGTPAVAATMPAVPGPIPEGVPFAVVAAPGLPGDAEDPVDILLPGVVAAAGPTSGQAPTARDGGAAASQIPDGADFLAGLGGLPEHPPEATFGTEPAMAAAATAAPPAPEGGGWWTRGAPHVPPMVWALPGLPSPDDFAYLLEAEA